MSNHIYECDTCRQQIEISADNNSIQLLNRCIITQGCTGELHTTLTANNPKSEIDYQARNVLYEHNQLLPSDTWTISHALGADPITYVYRDQLDENGKKAHALLDPDDYELFYIDSNTTAIKFSIAQSGIAHSLARSSNVVVETNTSDGDEFIQVTANSILTIAKKIDDDLEQTSTHIINFTSPSTGEVRPIPLTFHSHKYNNDIALFNTPWKGTDELYVGGYGYKVQSVRMDSVIASNAIEDGSPFFFDDSNFIILISNNPYENAVDISLDPYVNVTGLTEKSLNITAKVTGDELSIEKQHTSSYHPNIKVTNNTF